MTTVKIKPCYQTIEGILVPEFNQKCVREALHYKPKPGDVFISTYPKCGMTWMQNVALYIFRKGRGMEDPKDFQKLCPFIDRRGIEGIESMPRPGAFKTHFPYTHIPYSTKAKYIYVLRNPKDCCVSFYHHCKRFQPSYYSKATFDDFFEVFMAGEVQYNDYFDHLMSWYPHLKDEQVFFTTYEDMKKDLRGIILRLSSFLDQEYVEALEKDNNILNNILDFSSFDYMKKSLLDMYKDLIKDENKALTNGVHIDGTEKPVNPDKDHLKENPSKERKEWKFLTCINPIFVYETIKH